MRLATIIGLALIGALIAAAPAKADARADLDAAIAAENRGDLDAAIGLYTSAVRSGELSPRELAMAHNNRGIVHHRQRHLERAVADFDRAIALLPDLATAYRNRGAVRATLGRHDGAIADYTKVITLNPEDAAAYYRRGVLYQAQSRHQKAVADFTLTIGFLPEHARAYAGRGLAHENLGRREEAIADYRKALELKPDVTTATAGLARLESGGPAEPGAASVTVNAVLGTWCYAYPKTGQVKETITRTVRSQHFVRLGETFGAEIGSIRVVEGRIWIAMKPRRVTFPTAGFEVIVYEYGEFSADGTEATFLGSKIGAKPFDRRETRKMRRC